MFSFDFIIFFRKVCYGRMSVVVLRLLVLRLLLEIRMVEGLVFRFEGYLIIRSVGDKEGRNVYY